MQPQPNQSHYQSQLLDIWVRAMDPGGVGMPQAIASEIANYTREPAAVVLDRMARGKDEFTQRWMQLGVNVTDRAQVEAFYNQQFVEAYELADWHAGRTNGTPPLSYAHAAHVARTRHLKAALDFGSGIGTGALCLLDAGCDVDCADIATDLLRFVEHRVTSRGRHVHPIALTDGETPRVAHYDLITCFDVLEHVVDPKAKLVELESYLRPGGHLFVNLMPDSSDADRPMHISSAPDWLAWIRATSLVPDWPLFYYGSGAAVQVFVKSAFGKLRNRVASLIDAWQQRQR